MSDHAGRQKFTDWMDARIYVGDSLIHNRGLFARAEIRPGEIIARWGGILVPKSEWTPRLYRPTGTTQYDEHHYLTVPVGESIAQSEWTNHSCDANTWMLDEVTISARRFISAGEEVVTDIALWSDDDYLYTDQCLCGTPCCRGKITGKDWQRADVQKSYSGHLIPFLNQLIARQKFQSEPAPG